MRYFIFSLFHIGCTSYMDSTSVILVRYVVTLHTKDLKPSKDILQ